MCMPCFWRILKSRDLENKLVFGEFVELKMFQRVRRERIYPFRNVG